MTCIWLGLATASRIDLYSNEQYHVKQIQYVEVLKHYNFVHYYLCNYSHLNTCTLGHISVN